MGTHTKPKKRKTGIPRLVEIAGTKKWWLIGSMILAVAASIAQFTPFVAVYMIIKELAAHATDVQLLDKTLIWRWGFISLGAICLYGILIYASLMLSHIAAFNILYELRVAIARKLARLPLGYFTKRASGEIKKVMSEDVERIELFVAHHIPDVTAAVVFPLLMMGYLFYADWRLALVVLVVFLFAVAIQASMMLRPTQKKQYADYHAALGRMNASIVEYVRGIQVVKVFSRSMDSFKRLKQDIADFKDFCVVITKKFALIYTGFLTMLSSTILFITPVAVFLLLKAPSYVDYLPTVFLFLILGGGMFFPLLKLLYMSGYLNQNTLGVGLIDDILDKPEIAQPDAPKMPTGASVEFSDVTFAYDQKPVLKNVSFVADAGSVTALVGPSGAGKSTIGMLTARFWDTGNGQIRIGDVPIKNIHTKDLMDHVAFVFQDNMLFFDTIEENIRMGNRSASFDQVVAAAGAAQCHGFIESLENGYQTLVGEGGTYLSGGEQQRIALARAILKDAPIVVLDEATAYADPENEGKILAAFARLIQGKTVLVIAHRLSTITNADQILVVDKGSIAERGTHDALVARDGIYSHMWRTYTQSREWVLGLRGEGDALEGPVPLVAGAGG
ncbi:MsbA4: lipid A export ATP-binding/permease protein [Desulfosarcina variabilis str. Montpellier]|uniref:ABC transporter ATP-binding protein n=1 Tax=Desulfosarcina variabilis TaxID=2300 RepID=UPI003AFB6D75